MTKNATITHAAARQLIAADQLRQALDLLLADSRASAGLLNLSGRLADLERDQLLGLAPPDALDTRRNQLRAALLAWIERAEHPAAAGAADADARLKKRAFYLLLTLKIGLLLLILFPLGTSGYSPSEALTLIGILSPVFVGYVVTAAKGMGQPGLGEAARRGLPALKALIWGVFPLYFLCLFWVINRHPAGDWTFETARNWLAGIEAALGGVVLYVVNTLFENSQK